MRKLSTKKSCIIQIICFLLLFIIVWSALAFVFYPKTAYSDISGDYYRGKGYYGEKENSIDIFCIGNSNLYCGFSTMALYEKQGYTSYCSSYPYQSLAGGYNLFIDAINYQNPSLLVVETDFFYQKNDQMASGFMKTYKKIASPVINHARWKTLNKKDFYKKPNKGYYDLYKGYNLSKMISGYKREGYMQSNGFDNKVSFDSKIIISKIIDTCNENNIQVLFVCFPSATDWNEKRSQTVKKIADENSINFIDFNTKITGYDFIQENEFRDKGSHLNCYGAEKATEYLGNFIKENYDIKNTIDEETKEEWDNCLKKYKNQLK